MSATNALQIRPLAAPFGAEVLNIDLSQPMEAAAFERLHQAWMRHLVLVFRDQTSISPEDQIAFSTRFGELLPAQIKKYALTGHPAIGVVSNAKDETGEYIGIPNSGRNWHTDFQFDRRPPDATFLVSRELPAEGGNTLYADMYAAYDALPREMHERIAHMRVIHSRVKAWPVLYPDRAPLRPEDAAQMPDVSHPMVRTHPVTLRKALYIGGNMAIGIEGMADGPAMRLIHELRDFAVGARFTYSHRWRTGDAVLWDNRCTMHCATSYDDTKYRRVMHRTSMGPSVPV